MNEMKLAIYFHDNQHNMKPEKKIKLHQEMKDLKKIRNVHGAGGTDSKTE